MLGMKWWQNSFWPWLVWVSDESVSHHTKRSGVQFLVKGCRIDPPAPDWGHVQEATNYCVCHIHFSFPTTTLSDPPVPPSLPLSLKINGKSILR